LNVGPGKRYIQEGQLEGFAVFTSSFWGIKSRNCIWGYAKGRKVEHSEFVFFLLHPSYNIPKGTNYDVSEN
jgi:hypothetical protein